MQSRHTNFSIAKPIFSAHQIAGIRGHAAPRCVPCSPPTIAVDPVLTRQVPPPNTSHTLSNILDKAAPAVAPRPLRLAWSVSSRAFFVALSSAKIRDSDNEQPWAGTQTPSTQQGEIR